MTHGNVTRDPRTFARATKHLEIKEVLSRRSGRILDARQLIEHQRYDRFIRFRSCVRRLLRHGTPRFICPICWVPVSVVAETDKTFFFRHRHEDGSCPAQTRGKLSQSEINARKYRGQQESDAHRQIKNLIERSLRADPAISEIFQEARWRSSTDQKLWRQPDVQALFQNVHLAFEAQLSTTFLDVVIDRREFYRTEGALLVWVLRSFDPNYRRMTDDDIVFNNNSNILVVDQETVLTSETEKHCFFRCHYREPYIDGETLKDRWQQRLVSLDELTFNLQKQQAYWYDFEAAQIKAQDELRLIREEQQQKAAERARIRYQIEKARLCADFFSFWERNGSRE